MSEEEKKGTADLGVVTAALLALEPYGELRTGDWNRRDGEVPF